MSTIEAEFAELLRAIDRADIAYQAARKIEAQPARTSNRLFDKLMRRHRKSGTLRAFN